MDRLDRYLFREWLKVLAMAVLATVGLLLLVDTQDDLPDLRGFGVSTLGILRYYLVLIPTFLPIVLPISILVATLFVLGQFHRHHEITAMRAAGLSLWRITRSLWVAAALLSALLFYLNSSYLPRATEYARTLWNNYRFAEALQREGAPERVGLRYNLTFYNHRDGRLWFINRFNEYNYRAYGVTVSELDPQGREFRRLAANEGYFDDVLGHWVLLEGRITDFDPATDEALRSPSFDRRTFTQLYEEPDLMMFLERRPKELSLFQLTEIVTTLSPREDPRIVDYLIQYFQILLSPLGALISMGLAVPFAVRGVRTNPLVGVSQSVGLFVLYYLLVQLGDTVGRTVFPPFWTAFLPNLAMIALAIFLTWKATRPQ